MAADGGLCDAPGDDREGEWEPDAGGLRSAGMVHRSPQFIGGQGMLFAKQNDKPSHAGQQCSPSWHPASQPKSPLASDLGPASESSRRLMGGQIMLPHPKASGWQMPHSSQQTSPGLQTTPSQRLTMGLASRAPRATMEPSGPASCTPSCTSSMHPRQSIRAQSTGIRRERRDRAPNVEKNGRE